MFLFKAILMSLLPFYLADFPLESWPKDFLYIEYNHGRELRKQPITEGDTSYVELKKMLSKESQGWRYDLTSYVPSHTFNSPKMRINCTDNSLIVNYESGDNTWIQISKKGIGGSCPSVPSLRDASDAAKAPSLPNASPK